ncbi:MAG: hypothetical protein JWQ25_2091, partial [Daejeonella sp.]|nr:hypothetical protein [Daejeonella sp.]
IDPDYIGLIRNAKALITGNQVNAIIGGENGYLGDIVFETPTIQASRTVKNSIFAASYVFPNGTTSLTNNVVITTGLPKYLADPSDVIDASMLLSLNSVLKTDISLTNPDMVGADATSVLNMVKASDVWVTYVSSSAAFYNTIGYYTYPTASGPPAKASDIAKITYIFPNTKYAESKNKSDLGIKAGNKVKIGSFTAGTTIAFVLFQDAWDGSINNSATKFYSNSALNPEANTSIRRHNVLLHDVSRDLYVMGFEDQLRSSTDNDFNDVVLYAASSVEDAISDVKVANLPKTEDTDGDGVLNISDQFPSDPSRAYITYFPSKVKWGTLVFEDNWPLLGDYDLNDLVVSYRYTYISNAGNNVIDITGDYAVAAAGSIYKNGFGVQFPFSANAVSSVSGQKSISNYIVKAGNGVEAGQSKAVIVPFDNFEALIKNSSGTNFINTENNKPKILGDTAHIKVTLTSPLSFTAIGVAPYNPFIISNLRRGYEVHLPGNLPTDKADTKLFGTQADNSNAANPSSYYKTYYNWPWAMSFTEPFKYPAEQRTISIAYPHFYEWAGQPGSYLDWYSNISPGYRNNEFIYDK